MPTFLQTAPPDSDLLAVIEIVNRLINGLQTAPTLTSVAAVTVSHVALEGTVAGIRITVAAGTFAFTATTHDIAANADFSTEAAYLLSVDNAGAKTVTKGADRLIGDNQIGAPVPATPAGDIPVGTVRIRVDAGATPFDATTDNLDAAHLTTTLLGVGVAEVIEFTDGDRSVIP